MPNQFQDVIKEAELARIQQEIHAQNIESSRRNELHLLAREHDRLIEKRIRHKSSPQTLPEGFSYAYQAAKLMGLSLTYVHNLIRSEKIPADRFGGHLIIRNSVVEKIVKARKGLKSKQADHTFYERALM